MRYLPILAIFTTIVLVGCGSSPQKALQRPVKPLYAGQLHQPGAPVTHVPLKAVAVPSGAPAEAKDDGIVQAAGASCGKERWNVKTATDEAAGSIKLEPQTTTVAALGALPTTNPNNPDQPRDNGVESTVYRITAELVEAKRESDSDFHLVLHEGSNTMIAEIPDAPACTEPPVTTRVSVLEEQIEHARNAFIQEFGEPQSYPSPGLKIGHQVTITGVGFFDVPHGQTGVAPNAVELHPVLTIEDP